MTQREIKLVLYLSIFAIMTVCLAVKSCNSKIERDQLRDENKLLKFLYKRNIKKGPKIIYPEELTTDNVRFLIIKAGIQYPEIVLKQAIIETGNFNCKGCSLDDNNLFGFRVSSGYKKYNTWQSSVYDYAQWQKEHYKGGDYYQFLIDVGYAQDKNYIYKLKH